MLTVSVPKKLMGFWSLIFYKGNILCWYTRSSDPITISRWSCINCVQNEMAVQGFSFCSQKHVNPKVLFNHDFFVVVSICSLFLYLIFIQRLCWLFFCYIFFFSQFLVYHSRKHYWRIPMWQHPHCCISSWAVLSYILILPLSCFLWHVSLWELCSSVIHKEF